MLRRAGSSAGARVPAAVTQRRPCCVQNGYKGRFAFFRAATEPRNHGVSFRPFHSSKVLCIRFGHRARRRGRFGHRAPPLPDAQPRPNLGQTPNVSLTGGGSASRPHPVLCGRGHSARPGAAPHRAGASDAAGDRNPVPRRARCSRPEGNVPGRAGCPRRRPGAGSGCTAGLRPEVCPGAGPGCTAELRSESAPVQARACSQARTARTRRFSSPGCRSSPRKMFATCLATAPSETTSRSAICAFDSP